MEYTDLQEDTIQEGIIETDDDDINYISEEI